MMRGSYLCFEGPHGCGKSTLSQRVADLLLRTGNGAFHTTFPSERSPIGNLIRSYLTGGRPLANPKALLYLYAADGHDVDPWIRTVLTAGHHLIADRHPIYSGRVYQLAHHSEAHIAQVHGSTDIMIPDVLFIIDTPTEVALARMRLRNKYKAKIFETDQVKENELYRQRYLQLRDTAVAQGLARACVALDGTLPLDDLAYQAIASAKLR